MTELINDDFVISSNGFIYSLGSEDYGFLGEFNEIEDALKAFKAWCKENSYYPSLFFCSDHGNLDAIDYNGDFIS